MADSGALFDRTGNYRYLLWRRWAEGPLVTFVMLNPSTADEQKNDPTISRCISFAKLWQYGGVDVVNLFAFRSTDSKILAQISDPVGRQNDIHILSSAAASDKLVIAWGNYGGIKNRDKAVLSLLQDRKLYSLGINESGHPKHPLYVHSQTGLAEFRQLDKRGQVE